MRPSEGSGLSRFFVPAPRFFSLRFFAVSACLVTFTGVICAADEPHVKPTPAAQSSNGAKDVLLKSLAKMGQLSSYTSETDTGNRNSRLTQKIFFRLNPDGTTSERMETIGQATISGKPAPSKGSTSITQIRNSDGIYQLLSARKLAIKCVFLMDASSIATKIAAVEQPELESAIYGLSERQLPDGEPAYFVKRTDSDAEHQRKIDLVKKTLEVMKLKDPPNLAENVPFLTIYVIRKSDSFLLGTEVYNKEGSVISKIVQSNVRVNIPLADELFRVPEGFKMSSAATPGELVELLSGSKN